MTMTPDRVTTREQLWWRFCRALAVVQEQVDRGQRPDGIAVMRARFAYADAIIGRVRRVT